MDIIINLMFIIVPIFIGFVFIILIASIISPKFRGKLMSRQIKATRHMIDESKDDLSSLVTTMENIGINTKKNIMEQNEDTLRDLTIKEANIDKEGIEIRARAIKDGFSKDTMHCKHCGATIDEDSKFCKKCGKEQ